MIVYYHKRERDGNGFVRFDDPENSETEQLNSSKHMNALDWYFSQVVEIWLVFGRHEYDSKPVVKMHFAKRGDTHVYKDSV